MYSQLGVVVAAAAEVEVEEPLLQTAPQFPHNLL
jgi:hypothetical protein